MENHFEAIRSALATDATPELRSQGATSCRALLAILEPPPAVAEPPVDLAQIANSAIGMLRSVPADQLLDLAITTLRARLPPGVNIAPVRPISFHMIPPPPRAP